MEITKNTKIGELLKQSGALAYILMQHGMHCVGCPSSINETLEEACEVHGLDTEDVLHSVITYLKLRNDENEE